MPEWVIGLSVGVPIGMILPFIEYIARESRKRNAEDINVHYAINMPASRQSGYHDPHCGCRRANCSHCRDCIGCWVDSTNDNK